jgi:hypothetical protein
MRKIYIFLIPVVLLGQFTYAQWTPIGNNTYYNLSGNVGIGTTNPVARLNLGGTNSLNPNTGAEVDYTGLNLTFTEIAGGSNFNLGTIKMVQPFNCYLDHADMVFYTASGGGYNTEKMRVTGDGSIGIGTTAPGAILDVATPLNPGALGTVLARLPEGNASGAGTYLGIKGYNTQLNGNITNVNNVVSFAIEHSFYGITNSSINFLRGGSTSGGSISFNTNNNTEVMRLLSTGNVLIGQTSQKNTAYKLDVKGYVRADQIVVNADGSDFVFDPAYKLYPLSFVKKYINQNHHLPEIASAKEMQTEGLNVGGLQMKLLQKVEELTLYTISSDKQIQEQATIIEQQTVTVKELREEIEQLKQQMQLLLNATKKN